MSPQKRGLDDEAPDTPDTPHKRQRQCQQKIVAQEIQRAIREQYNTEIELHDLVMTACYLIVILGWEYQIRETDLDAFVALHPIYRRELPNFEEAQCHSSVWLIPAYHQWFKEQDLSSRGFGGQQPRVVNEQTLRRIGRESPYLCHLAELILDAIQATRP